MKTRTGNWNKIWKLDRNGLQYLLIDAGRISNKPDKSKDSFFKKQFFYWIFKKEQKEFAKRMF
jgi:hypothetical protein